MCSRKFTRGRWWRIASSAALANNRKFAVPNRWRKTTNQINSHADCRATAPVAEWAGEAPSPTILPELRCCRFFRHLHGSLELGRFFFDSEVVGIKFGD